MFEIVYTNEQDMREQTNKCFSEIQGIEELIAFQNELFGTDCDGVCFGDAQIDGLAYPPSHDCLTVYIAYCLDPKTNCNAHYVIDFFEPELFYFDIEFNTHWIDEVEIQKNKDGKYSISFGSGECNFRYSYARVNRCWKDKR